MEGISNIISLPLAFVRSGYVHLSESYMDYVGDHGFGRSRTASIFERNTVVRFVLFFVDVELYFFCCLVILIERR